MRRRGKSVLIPPHWNHSRFRGASPSALASPPDPVEAQRVAITSKADDFDKVRAAVEEASSFVRGLWVTFVSLTTYFLVAAASVTHLQLFQETPIKMPLLDVTLPLVSFFVVAPFFLLVVHFYLLLQLIIMADKVRRFNEVLAALGLPDATRRKLRQQLPNDLLVQFLAGPRDQREGVVGLMFNFVAWMTIVGGPLFVLLLNQYKFLPYQDEAVTWMQRLAVLGDLLLLFFTWSKIVARGERVIPPPWQARASHAASKFGVAFVAVCALVALTFPGESLDGLAPQQTFHRIFSRSLPVEATETFGEDRKPAQIQSLISRVITTCWPTLSPRDLTFLRWFEKTPEARRLIAGNLRLSDADLVDKERLWKFVEHDSAKTKEPWKSDRVGNFGGRNFVAANFAGVDLRQADVQDSIFDHANLSASNLDGITAERAHFNKAVLTDASILGANLSGSVFQEADLFGANLQGALASNGNFRGTLLQKANLRSVSFSYAGFAGASFFEADLQGASFGWSNFAGASFKRAHLEGTRFVEDGLRGSSLVEAELKGATFEDASLEGAFPNSAELQRAGATITGFDQPPLSTEELQGFLEELACNSEDAPYVALGLLANGRLRNNDSYLPKIIKRMREGRNDILKCPGVRGFTDQDWDRLDD